MALPTKPPTSSKPRRTDGGARRAHNPLLPKIFSRPLTPGGILHTRRRRAAAAGLAAVALTGGTLAVTTSGPGHDGPIPTGAIHADINGDGHPDSTLTGKALPGMKDTEGHPLKPGDTIDTNPATLTQQRDTLATLLAPHKGKKNPGIIDATGASANTLITPPGTDWWTLTTSQAPQLRLYDVPAPKDANWYATTEHKATDPQGDGTATYTALHIGFPTTKQATAYALKAANDPSMQWRSQFLRGRILTYLPPYAFSKKEPFLTLKGKTQTQLADLHPTAAAWSIHYGHHNALHLADIKNPGWRTAYQTFLTNLGYTDNTIWNGAATNPHGPFVGTITGYNTKAINITKGATALATTGVSTCQPDGSCIETNPGLINLGLYTTYKDHTLTMGMGTWLPTNAPKSADITFAINQGDLTGLLNATNANPNPPAELITGWIHGDTMTLNAPKGPAPILDPNKQ